MAADAGSSVPIADLSASGGPTGPFGFGKAERPVGPLEADIPVGYPDPITLFYTL